MRKACGIVVAIAAMTSSVMAQPGTEAAAAAEAMPAEPLPAEPPVAPAAQAMPAAQPMQPPAGATQATFASTTPQPWEVLLDRNPGCVTPCSLWIPPYAFVTLRSMERRPVLLAVGRLPPQPVVVTGKHLEEGKYAAGITFTALSGMSLVTGVSLLAVGYGVDNRGMRLAGFISGGVGAIGLYLSIQLMRAAVPRADISPAGEVRF